MNTPYLTQRREVFQRAMDLPAAERELFVEHACNHNPQMIDDVRSLLAAAEDDDFLSRPAPHEVAKNTLQTRAECGPTQSGGHAEGDLRREGGGRATGLLAPELSSGSRVGSYRILHLLGSGGMGVVYAAEQDSPRREVALKVILPGLIAPSLLRRFTHEAHALGLLQHPGIARVYEAGTEGAGPTLRPFLAMELVRGLPLSEYVQKRRPETATRLELFAKVCDAVHHAHQRGVIHRDLKPANILVEDGDSHDGADPQPKILDFGVARILSADAGVTTMQTAAGQMIGTPAYMSPEQISGDPDATDVRSDVYSMGVILFELLSGRLPHDLTGKPLAEAARIIRDEMPSRLTAVSRTFRGDLDVIVSKAMAKEKDRRYDSTSELAADVRRYLGNEPILARRDSAMYVLTRTLRRYRWAAAAALGFVTLMMVFAVWAAVSAREYRRLAVKEAAARGSAEINALMASESAKDAQRETQRADAELRASTIDRGRLLGLSADRAAGEALLWREHLKDPESAETLWALREFYRRNPCRITLATPVVGPWSLTIQPTVFDGQSPLVAMGGPLGGTVYLFDATAATPAGWLNTGASAISGLAFGPDPRVLYAVHPTGCLSEWALDPAGGAARLLRIIDTGHKGEMSIACSPDGRWVATCDYHGEVKFWYADSMDLLTSYASTARALRTVQFGPENRNVYVGDSDGKVWVYPIPPLHEPILMNSQPDAVSSLAVSPDESLLAIGGTARSFSLLDARSGERLSTIKVGTGTIRSATFTDGGLTLMVSSWWTAEMWDVSDPVHPVRSLTFSGGPGPFIRGVVTPDRRTLISSHNDGMLRYWDLAASEAVMEIEPPPGHRGRRGIPAASPDGATIAMVSANGVDLWDVATQAYVRHLASAGAGNPTKVSYNATGTWIGAAISGQRGTAMWDLSTDGPPLQITPPLGEGYVHQVRISPDGTRAAASHDSGLIRVWDLSLQRILGEYRVGRRVPGLEFSPDGGTIYGCCSATVVEIDGYTAAIRRITPAQASSPYSMGISRDGSLLGTGDWNRTVSLFDTSTLALRTTLAGHSAMAWSVKFSSDNRTVLSAGDDGRVKLWDITTGKNLFTLDAAEDRIQTADFVGDGRYIVYQDRDSRTFLFDTTYFDKHIAGNAEYQLAKAWPLLTPEQRDRATVWISRLVGHPAIAPKPPDRPVDHQLGDVDGVGR